MDLAGSESLRKSGESSEERLAEARCINGSLSALGKVVMGLSTGAAGAPGHVPFRDSKLTRVLKVLLPALPPLSYTCTPV